LINETEKLEFKGNLTKAAGNNEINCI